MTPNRGGLVVQWEDSAPDMDYDEWLAAEVDIQRELLDDLDGSDLFGLRAALNYIVEIIDEIERRNQ